MIEIPSQNSKTVINVVEVSSKDDTRITSVSLYSGLAEVTRTFKANLKGGDNKVVILGLPNVLIPESLRVEGHGPCTIHEVSTSEISRRALQKTLQLTSLLRDKERLGKAIARCQTCISSVEKYQESLDVRYTPAEQLSGIGQGIETVASDLDKKLIELEEKVATVTRHIQDERKTLGEVKEDDKLRQRVSVTVAADKECEVEFVLIYGVRDATWDAAYDIYVKMDEKDKPVALIYKGAILQDTGESWDDISLTLETVTPTMGLTIPKLEPWTLSEYRPRPAWRSLRQPLKQRRTSVIEKAGIAEVDEEVDEDEDMGFGLFDDDAPAAPMTRRAMRITSKGDINATFIVPGLISVPSDGETHNVTVCELALNAVMSWVSVPKSSLKAHLMAKIQNESEFTLLDGVASIYVDGSFISRSSVLSVRPQETFDCPLGVDPTVRITYHPRSKRVNQSGFTRKTCSYIFEQRITIVNTKATTTLSSIKIQDQIPVSEDERIVVKLANPPLLLPSYNKKGVLQPVESVTIRTAENGCRLSAHWAEMEEVGMGGIDPILIGKSGKLNWICEELPAQGKIVIVLSWEVVCPYGTDVMGLDS